MRIGILGSGRVAGQVEVTCSLPVSTDDTRLVVAHTSPGAEQLARRVRRARVVSAFGTVPGEVLCDVFEARRRRSRRPSLVDCGDDAGARDLAAGLIRDAGFEPMDTGPLRIAR